MADTQKTNRVMSGGSSMTIPGNHMIEKSGAQSSLSIQEQNKCTQNILISTNIMKQNQLSKLSKAELISLLFTKQTRTNAPRAKRRDCSKPPVAAPRRSVKQMVEDYENNITAPPTEFQDKPITAPSSF